MKKQITRRELLKRTVALAGGLTVASPILSACAPKVVKETVEVVKEVTRVVEKEKIVVATPAARKPYKVLFDGGNPDSDYCKAIAKLFHEWYPEYTVEFRPIPATAKQERYQKLLTMIASKTVGDVFDCAPAHFQYDRFAKRGLLLDIMPMVKAEGYDLGVFVPITMTQMTLEGKLYGFPQWTYAGYDAIVTNDEMFAEVGVPEWEEDTITADGMLDVGVKLTRDVDGDGRTDTWGWYIYPQLDHVLNHIRMFDGDVISADGRTCVMNQEGSLDALRWFYKLMEREAVPTAAVEGGSHGLFISGKLGQRYAGAHNILGINRDLVGERAFDWSYVNLPRSPSGKHPSNLRVGAWVISRITKGPEASWAYLKTAASHKGGVFYGTLAGGSGMAMGRTDVLMDPVFTTTRPGWLTALAAMQECMPQHYPANMRGDEVWDVFEMNFAKFLARDWGVEEAADKITEAVQEVLDKSEL